MHTWIHAYIQLMRKPPIGGSHTLHMAAYYWTRERTCTVFLVAAAVTIRLPVTHPGRVNTPSIITGVLVTTAGVVTRGICNKKRYRLLRQVWLRVESVTKHVTGYYGRCGYV